MLLILLIILLIFIILFCTKIDANYANPIFIVFAVFTIGCIVAAANMTRWDFELSGETAFVITSILVAWLVGCLIGERLSFRIGTIKRGSYKVDYCLDSGDLFAESNPSDARILFATIIQFILVGYYIYYYFTSIGGFSSMFFSNLREQMMSDEEVPFLIGHCILITRTIAMVFIYHLIKAIINGKKRSVVKDLPPIVLYFILEIFGTSRSGFVYIGGYIVVVYLLLYLKKYGRSRRIAKKTRNTIVRIGLILIFVFIVLGNLTGKTQYMGIIDMISMYIGAPICNVQYYLENSSLFVSPYFGAYTQPFLASVQRALHVQGTEVTTLYYPFVKYGETRGRTNIFTAIVKPMIDFGHVGTIFFYLLCGIFIGTMYRKVLKPDCSKYRLIMFGYLCMPLFLFGLEFQIGNYWLATRTLYVVIYTFIFSKIIRGEKQK